MRELSQIADKIKSADAILIGASNGLSITVTQPANVSVPSITINN